jgi:uncharacterized BrkB/YihY/UPF0761 family membrane protein
MKFIVPTLPFNSRCLPDLSNIPKTFDEIAGAANISITLWWNQSMNDVENSWEYIVSILGGSALFSFILTLLMRWLSGVSVLFSILLFIGGLGTAVGFSAYKYIGDSYIYFIAQRETV